ncbi:hypothetical protein UFOVP272_27 [uncultured Caudovirales phage]|uniref:Uncharacterized protein n=1 Tax=uncultured Caudovirales phage TaxID=2100421 RepID=A0A6J5LME0_9CAUD|nr:hypothetical protein UFOVP272_27 [uncultured Caudovirales phage]
MKIQTKLYIYFCQYSWETEGKFVPFAYPHESVLYTFVCEQEIELDVPDNFDPRANQIAALEKQKQKVMADYQKSVAEINDRISKLQALEYTA